MASMTSAGIRQQSEDDSILERVLLINEPDVRLVRHDLADGLSDYILETRDGIDAMGIEKWRKFEVNGTALKALFKYLVRIAEKQYAKAE